MLAEGALPSMGIAVVPGGPGNTHVGQCVLTDRETREADGNAKITFADTIPATKVPWPLFALFEKPSPSWTKSSPPITEPSSSMGGNPGRLPESINATMTPEPLM